MENKKQDEKLLEELVKTADSYRAFFANLADELSKVLTDVKAPDEEEDTWEMECPYKYGEYHWVVYDDGEIGGEKWVDSLEDDGRFLQGNIFQTEQAAELEAKRRNLLTRFRSFRDECNRDWKVDWSNQDKKWGITNIEEGMHAMWTIELNSFLYFGYFKNQADCERAIELFGDEIKELFVE
jgi:hypothetical protein